MLGNNYLKPERETRGRVITSGSGEGTGSSKSRRINQQRTMQEFTSLDSASNLIANVFNKNTNNGNDLGVMRKGRSTPSGGKLTSSGGSANSVSENLNDDSDKHRTNMNAFYFVKRSTLKVEDLKKMKKQKLRLRSISERMANEEKNAKNDKSCGSSDEANAGIEESSALPPSFERTVSTK